MRIGIIGTGHMGGMLATAFCEAGSPTVNIYNRNHSKAQRIQAVFPTSIHVCVNEQHVVSQSDVTFLCTKFTDIPSIAESIRPILHPSHYVISINSHVTLQELETILPCKIAKVIPSITQTALSGILLFMGGSRLDQEDEVELLELLSQIGVPHPIAETKTRVYSDLTSCGPAFIANWLLQFAHAAEVHGVKEEEAEHLLAAMVEGLGRLVTKKEMTLQEIVSRVSVPGGVTEAGLHVLQGADQHLLLRVLDATQAKQDHLATHKTK